MCTNIYYCNLPIVSYLFQYCEKYLRDGMIELTGLERVEISVDCSIFQVSFRNLISIITTNNYQLGAIVIHYN